MNNRQGYTLIELMVAVGLFALIMLLASGAYLMMIGISRQVQGITTSVDNLSFALETMTRDIRTGTDYGCDLGGDCNGGNKFSFTNGNGAEVSYDRALSALSGPSTPIYVLQRTTISSEPGVPSTVSTLTDPSSVDITSLKFYATGTAKGDGQQPRVTIVVTGTVSYGPGNPPQPFTIETGASMHGPDI